MGTPVLIPLLIGVGLIVLIKLKRVFGQAKGFNTEWPLYARRVLTPVEQKCYHRLHMSFPNHVVLAQVSLSQMLGVKKGHSKNYQAILNRYRLLSADFVLCNRDFSIAAVFELDDKSHDHPRRQYADSRKTQALAPAGIPLYRFNAARLPDEVDLKALQLAGPG